MSMTISTITFLVGLGLIVLGIFGGGIEVKEIKIPNLPAASRMMSVAAGSALLTICIIFPEWLVPPVNGGGTKPPLIAAIDRNPGSAIRNGLTTVREVKLALQSLGRYSGPIDDEKTDAYFQAVGEFQVSQKIDADGMVGGVTFPKLREVAPLFFRKATDASPKTVDGSAEQKK